MMQPSHVSQLVQMADIVAYAAHQHLRKATGRRDMADWYTRFIAPLVEHPGADPDGVVRK